MGLFSRLFRRRHKHAATPSADSWELSSTQAEERHYLDEAFYLLPKDWQEGNRLDFQHFLLRLALHSNFVAPISPFVQRILDVGTGTGIWAREMATQFPSAFVTGVDLEPPVTTQAPPNCQFVKADILKGLPYPPATFDFTHQRLMMVAIPALCWPSVIHELVRVTRPGGWIELVEGSSEFAPAGPLTSEFLHWWDIYSRKEGFDLSLLAKLGLMLQSTGLSQVQEHRLHLPLGTWDESKDRRIGFLLQKDILVALGSFRERFYRVLAVPYERFDMVLQGLATEWEAYHTMLRFYIAYGQR